MHPILFKIGPVSIYSYGFMLALAFLVSLYLARRAAKEVNLPPDLIINLALLLLFSGIIGARLLYVLLNMKDYIANPVEILMLQHGGLSFYGAIITAIPTAVIYIKRKGLSIYKIGDLIVPYVALGQAIGRIGCFLNGCCFGKPTDSFLRIIFPGGTHSVHPTQIYSSFALLCLYGFLRFLQPSLNFSGIGVKVKEGTVLLSYGILYSAGRFLMEFLRGDNIVSVFGLTFSQFVSVIVFFVCLILLWKNIISSQGP